MNNIWTLTHPERTWPNWHKASKEKSRQEHQAEQGWRQTSHMLLVGDTLMVITGAEETTCWNGRNGDTAHQAGCVDRPRIRPRFEFWCYRVVYMSAEGVPMLWALSLSLYWKTRPRVMRLYLGKKEKEPGKHITIIFKIFYHEIQVQLPL